MGPIYGPEDLVGGWVPKRKKRKPDIDQRLPPAKRLATSGQPDFRVICDSDADDKEELIADENHGEKCQQSAVGTPYDEGQQTVRERADEGQQSTRESVDNKGHRPVKDA